jgi:dihydroorotate dehydrogenase
MPADIYTKILRPIIFSGLKLDPEWAHLRALSLLEWMGTERSDPASQAFRRWLTATFCVEDESLAQTLWGIRFANPMGLAAGFDKDGVGAGIWQYLGFGYAELGTVTRHAQPGNPQPRLFRLVEDRAILNRMGFNNAGAMALAERLTRIASETPVTIPLGINLGKSKVTPLEDAVSDYVASFRQLKERGDYFVVNVSSPNTPGLRSLQSVEQLQPILTALQNENDGQKPLLVKISPDLDWEAIAAVTDLAQSCQLAGIIATNTTIGREGLKTTIIKATGHPVTDEAGGISGEPLRQRSVEVIRFIYQRTQGTLPIVGVGGIFTADDAWEKITAGASLLQTYTGWIYEGPGMIPSILEGLRAKLKEHQLTSLREAVGMAANSLVQN